MEIERTPYFALKSGESVLFSNVKRFAPQFVPGLAELFKGGELAMQGLLFDQEDSLLFYQRGRNRVMERLISGLKAGSE